MAKNPKPNRVVETPAPKGQDTPAVEQAVAATSATIDAGEVKGHDDERDDRRHGMKAMVCMPVIYRDDREHNGQADLAAVVTGLPGDDAHGAALAHLYVTPPLGAPFWLTAPQWTGDEDEQPARTWRFVF